MTEAGRENRGVLIVEAFALAVMWAHVVASVWTSRGLFDWLGIDFALFSAAARLLFSSRPWEVYDADAMARALTPYLAHYGPGADALKLGPMPYPATMYLIYAPFLSLAPAFAFAAWSLCSAGLGLVVTRGLSREFPQPSWPLAFLLLTFFPLVYGVFVGQPVAVLLLALYMAHRDWERGRDFRAGLWAGVLFLKIQYPLVIALVLLCQRRWRSLAGMAAAGGGMSAFTLAATGPRGVVGFLGTVRAMSSFHPSLSIIYPEQMINYRGLLTNLLGSALDERTGQALTFLLAAATLASLRLVWRGGWDPTGSRFSAQMLATLLATILSSTHSHVHGATLLLVPGAMIVAREQGSAALRRLLIAGLFLPTPLFAVTRVPEFVSLTFIVLMLAALGTIAAEAARPALHPTPAAA